MREYQLFDSTFSISDHEREELEDHLSNWVRLHSIIRELNSTSLKKLIVVESEGRARSYLIKRLHSRLLSLKREQYRGEEV